MEIADKWDKDYDSAVKLQVLPETKKQINSDVLRTFSHSSAFSEGIGKLGRHILTRVLEAITVSTTFGMQILIFFFCAWHGRKGRKNVNFNASESSFFNLGFLNFFFSHVKLFVCVILAFLFFFLTCL